MEGRVGYVHATNECVDFNISKFIYRQCYNSVLQLPCCVDFNISKFISRQCYKSVLQLPCCGLVFIEGHRVYITPSPLSCNLSTLVNVGLIFNTNQVNAGRCPASMFFENNVRGQPIP